MSNANKPLLLIVDDEPQIRRLLSVTLEANGYRTLAAVTGQEGLVLAAQHRPALVVLDLGLPDMTGQDVLRRLREWSNTPVIILSVQDDESGKVAALDGGADDYVTKPFNAHEVVARVKSLLRRVRLDQSPSATPHVLTCGGLRLDLDQHTLTVDESPVELTRTEFNLLEAFLSNPGYTLTRDDLLEKAIGYAYEGLGRALDTHIRNLRRKIEPDPDSPTYIQTIYGVGYRLKGDE